MFLASLAKLDFVIKEKSAPHGLYSFGGFVAPEFRPPASK